jgi:hypothetical protein
MLHYFNVLAFFIEKFVDDNITCSFLKQKNLWYIIGITFYMLEQKKCNKKDWKDIVTLAQTDVRYWNAPEKADIMVYLYSHGHLLKF